MDVVKEVLKMQQPDIVMFQETKCEECDRIFIRSVWGTRFRRWAVLPSTGRSGGILIMWDDRVVSKCEVVAGVFSLSINFRNRDNKVWWLTGVYGPIKPGSRQEWWDELAGLFGLCSPNWCVGGDFNVVRLASEKLNGVSTSRSMRDFDSFIRDCELIDLPLSNARFTWSNLQENRVCCKLDRFLHTLGCKELFPDIRQEVGPRVVSDHCPMILESCPFKWGPNLFRFENMWLENRSFKEFFKD
ncbi:uncharacterized protein LOC114293463 [Camellia sinensis]|uniref:uncharacterized protein LOC114293463 n=1 Tax=Camellia sinensis TaxID=4442 RepID=UPI0010357942|nr:uncharacterized protein LOC114293463 [Camellia sinensis]